MWYDEMFLAVEKAKDEVQGEKMSKYMKNNFYFLGIPKPKLKELTNSYLKTAKNLPLDWNFVDICWAKDYREAQYIALLYLAKFSKKLEKNDLEKLKKLIINKSWWETIDNIDALVGNLALKYPKIKNTMLKWSKSDNIWLKRVSIDFQQEYKEQTDTLLLEQIIINNFGSSEFFINKSIGWSLREYSKINPLWVKNFILEYEEKLNKLSIKEASKYI